MAAALQVLRELQGELRARGQLHDARIVQRCIDRLRRADRNGAMDGAMAAARADGSPRQCSRSGQLNGDDRQHVNG